MSLIEVGPHVPVKFHTTQTEDGKLEEKIVPNWR